MVVSRIHIWGIQGVPSLIKFPTCFPNLVPEGSVSPAWTAGSTIPELKVLPSLPACLLSRFSSGTQCRRAAKATVATSSHIKATQSLKRQVESP